MMHKNNTYVSKTETINPDTGEIAITSTTTKRKVPKEPSFVKMYIEDIVLLNSIPPAAGKLLMSLVKRVNYDNEIVLAPKIKRDIMKEMAVTTTQTVDNMLKELKAKSLVLSIDRGVYMLNPNYFAKGGWTDVMKIREKYLKIVISYCDGKRTIKGEL